MNWRDKMDQLILEYVKGGDAVLFEEVYGMLAPLAKQYSYGDKWGLPQKELEGIFWDAVWEATPEYNGKSHFIQRVMAIYKERRIDLYRYYQRQKRRGLLSWEQLTPENLGRLPNSKSAEDEALDRIRVEEIKKMLVDFGRVHERESNALQHLAQGCTGKTLAQAIGAPRYGAKERKFVQRAREKFRKYAATYSQESNNIIAESSEKEK